MGNTAHCRFQITVADTQPPVIDRCRSPDPIVTSDLETEATWEMPKFSDNSGFPVTVYKSHESGSILPVGVTEVEYLAMDDAGNTKRCLIYIRIQKNPCAVPSDPENGRISCRSSENGLLVCTMSCDRGYGFAIAPSPVYHCDQDGIWYPKQQLPWADCSAQNAANTGVKALQFELRTDECDPELIEDIERSLSRELATKVMQYCSHSVRCRLEHLRVRCHDRNVNGLGPQALHARTDDHVTSTDKLSIKYSEFRKNVPPNVVVDLNVTAYIRPGRGDTISGPPELIQEHVMNSLSSIPNAMFEDLSEGQLDLGMDTLRSGAEERTGSLVSMDSQPSQLVCQPGAALVNGTQCVQCSRGMFYNSVNSECERCPVGTYQDDTGRSECKLCPDGFSTLTSSAKSIDNCKELCSAGTYSVSGMEQCEGCPRGTYQPHRGMMECIECPKGTSTHKTGSITESECAVPCAAGHVSRSGFLPCLPCPVGYFQPRDGMTSCVQCPNQATTSDKGASSIYQCQGLLEADYKTANVSDLSAVFYNECFSAPCQNDGECFIVPSGYLCSCKPGFAGAKCDENINECLRNTCLNNATCVDLINDFTCVCPSGFVGSMCAVDIDECASQPCQHNSSCIDGPNSYHCQCSKGYQGTNCDIEINECTSAPCHNGGRCIDFIGGYLCACLNGFHGDQCDEELDECVSQPCANNGSCHDQPGYYSCSCQSGFDGFQCEIDIDECTSSPCQNGGECVDDINGFICHCLPGFSGQICEIELPWNFSLVFEHSGTTDYILLEKSLPDLSEVTVAFWMQTTDSGNYGCPFSYATSDEVDNALTLMDYTGFALYINGQAVVTDVTANDGLWHHIIVTWSNQERDWHIYKGGKRRLWERVWQQGHLFKEVVCL
ncbi:sushi, von Willebrand factor type A, EGF and pentraxin domain-containing protein 1-like [Amphiura filiformis]|uniref:sushi, von Willebrand factor type A, EGF and pentraxin domain-containing protein 1-like n=1 Tax=Amphiura filiformis TaxID=82378 RepID=UPI003B20E1CF